jgi:hypothetical protein
MVSKKQVVWRESNSSMIVMIMINKNFKMKNQMEKKNRIENLEEESRLKICNQTFINKIDLDKSIKWNALVGIILFSLLSEVRICSNFVGF